MRAQKNIANGRTEKTTQFEQFESCWIMNVSEHEAVDDWQTRKIFTRSARWKITLQNKIDNEILWSLGTNTQHTAHSTHTHSVSVNGSGILFVNNFSPRDDRLLGRTNGWTLKVENSISNWWNDDKWIVVFAPCHADSLCRTRHTLIFYHYDDYDESNGNDDGDEEEDEPNQRTRNWRRKKW